MAHCAPVCGLDQGGPENPPAASAYQLRGLGLRSNRQHHGGELVARCTRRHMSRPRPRPRSPARWRRPGGQAHQAAHVEALAPIAGTPAASCWPGAPGGACRGTGTDRRHPGGELPATRTRRSMSRPRHRPAAPWWRASGQGTGRSMSRPWRRSAAAWRRVGGQAHQAAHVETLAPIAIRYPAQVRPGQAKASNGKYSAYFYRFVAVCIL